MNLFLICVGALSLSTAIICLLRTGIAVAEKAGDQRVGQLAIKAVVHLIITGWVIILLWNK